jgi:leucyl/phenylalanyl-tRNA--protein transferase
MIRLPLLDADHPDRFPPAEHALADPNGLLAFGGDLSSPRLLAAYANGIFPWFSAGEPILWWSPDPRCVFATQRLRPKRSLRRALRGSTWQVTADRAFDQVIRACAAPRAEHAGTLITADMIVAYEALLALGHAHSVEVWDGDDLVGGIYGIGIGHLFCGESMFSARSGGSKVALMTLAHWLRQWDFPLLDAQVTNPHLLSLGAVEIPRAQFVAQAQALAAQAFDAGVWRTLAPLPATALLE